MNDEYRHPVFLTALGLLLFFTALGARDFWAPVEPRYAEIARVMFERGEWIVPRINGDLYTDKPILYFWLVLIASHLVGSVNEWTVRFPAALGGLGLILVTYRFGKDFFNPRVGFLAGVVVATSVRVIWEARWAHLDMLFTFFFAAAMYFAARGVLFVEQRPQMLAAYALMALATLTKGLIGVVLPALILISFMVVRRDWSLLRQSRLIAGIAIFLLIAAPWFLWVSLATQGQWLKEFLLVHHMQRYTAGLGHREPFYYYLTTLPADFLPWTIFALPALFTFKLDKRCLEEPQRLFFILWFSAIFAFFTLSDTKRGLYLLPLFIPLALFVGTFMDRLISGAAPQGKLYRGFIIIFFGLLCLGCLALPIATWLSYREALFAILPGSIAMAAGSLAVVYFAWHRMPEKVFLATSLTMLLGVIAMSLWGLPFVDPFKSPRPFAREIIKHVPSDSPLYIYADAMHDFNFYTRREAIPIIRAQADLQKLLSQDVDGYVLIKEKDLKRIKLAVEERIIVMSRQKDRSWYLLALGRRNRP